MNHVFLGAAIPLLIALPYLLIRRGRIPLPTLIAFPALMLACAIWAVIPDIPRITGHATLYLRLMNDPRMNIFFWHYRLDQIETESTLYNAGVAFLLISLMGIAWNELRTAERR